MSLQIGIINFEKICRTCLIQKENMTVIKVEKIKNMIEACSHVQISFEDSLPNQICMDCLEQCLKSYHFKQQCELSNEILQKILLEYNSITFNKNFLENKFEAQLESKPTNIELNSSLQKFEQILLAPLGKDTLNKLKLELITEGESQSYNDEKFEIKNESVNDDVNEKDIEFTENTNCSWNSLNFDDDDDDDEDDDNYSETSKSDRKNENKTPKTQILINNMKLMDGDKCSIEKLICNVCNKTFLNSLALARHLNTHSETRILTLKCNECGKDFSEPGNLTKHINRHKGNPQYNCDKCNKKFYELHPLALHMKKKHGAQPMKCKHCNMTLYHPLQQERHDRIHAQKVCNICGKICKTAKLLKRHKTSHSNDRPFNCDICDKSFKFNFEVTKHKKICHSGPQPREICSICGKSILCRSLASHLKSHDKGTLYKCEYCPKSYYCEETLKQHVKHKHTNVDCHYKLLCSICGRKVISPKDLKIHMMSHTQDKLYQCQLCEKRYKTPGALMTHVRYTHEDKRPFSCTVCSKAFHTKVILQNHMRTHTGERPFTCAVCNRAFGSKSILKTHMKTHGGY